jgi:hypothetical protein
MTSSTLPPEDGPSNWAVTQQDWNEATAEWRAATQASILALDTIAWPQPDLKQLDVWLAAVDRQTIAKTRLAALCERQWQKS